VVGRVSTYLNFMGKTEEAFRFYAGVFGTEIVEPISRMGDVMPEASLPPMEGVADLIMHIEVPILGGHMLMGTDVIEAMGQQLHFGNNISLNLEPDTRAEADRLFAALSEGGSDTVGLDPMPWGSLWGVTLDRFGIRWMFNVSTDAD
jgi:PhnB protein